METKVLKVDNFSVYEKLSIKYAEKGDYVRALSFLFKALDSCKERLSIFSQIANLYSEMGLYQKSIKYWYKFLSIAPKSRRVEGYENLARNYFYLEKVWICGYYLKKIMDIDGIINKDDIEDEIVEFFSDGIFDQKELKKTQYQLIKPQEKGGYIELEEKAKKCLFIGDISTAITILESIPKELLSLKGYIDLQLIYYNNGLIKKLISCALDCLKYYKDNLTSLCFLVTSFDRENNVEKSGYYYKRAVEVFNIRDYDKLIEQDQSAYDEVYKLFVCAATKLDHQTVEKTLEYILKDEVYDLDVNLYYGIYYLNAGKYEQAIKKFSFILNCERDNVLAKFYLDFANAILNGQECDKKLLPFDYNLNFPLAVNKQYKEIAQQILKGDKNGKVKVNSYKKVKMLADGIKYGNSICMDNCAHALSYAQSEIAVAQIKKLLIDPLVKQYVKKLFIYSLIADGHKEKIYYVTNDIFSVVKPHKFSFEKNGYGQVIFCGYAIAVAFACSYSIDCTQKLGKSTQEIYQKYYSQMVECKLEAQEIAAIILHYGKYQIFKDINFLCTCLNIEKERIEKFIKTEN